MRQTVDSVTRILRFGGFIAGAALLAACAAPSAPEAPRTTSSGAASQPAQTEQPAIDPNAPFTVALLAPTSASGERLSRAAQDIVTAATMARGDFGDEVTLKVYDTRGDAAAAAEAAARALSEGASLILGPVLGASAEAVGPVAAGQGVNVLSFSNDASVAGDNVWVLGQLPGEELRRVMGYAASQGVTAVGVVYPTNRYGEAVAAEAAAAGSSVGVSVGPFVPYERSFQGIERATKDGAPSLIGQVDGVLIADIGDGLRSAASFLAYYDVSRRNVRYMGTSRWADPKNTKEQALEGGWFAMADRDARASFDQRFRNQMGRAPSSLAALGYDAVAAASALAQEAKSTGQPIDAVAVTNPRGFDGAAGRFVLTSDGLNRRGLAVMEVTGDGFVTLDPAPASPGGV